MMKHKNTPHEKRLLEYILDTYVRLTAKDADIKQANATAQRGLVPTRCCISTNGLSTLLLLDDTLYADDDASTFAIVCDVG